jgi:hypothetical protein
MCATASRAREPVCTIDAPGACRTNNAFLFAAIHTRSGVGVYFVAGSIGFLAFRAITENRSPPQISLRPRATQSVPDGYSCNCRYEQWQYHGSPAKDPGCPQRRR